jgi:uncharacterized protein YjbI with pentapeptide repeats
MSLLPDIGSSDDLPTKPLRWEEFSRSVPRGLRWLWRLEWFGGWLVYLLRRSALLQLFEVAAAFSIPIAILAYMLGTSDRSRERLYRSSEIIGKPRTETTDAARRAAMEDLASQNLALTRVHLPDSSYLWGIDLRGANLNHGRMRDANLYDAKLGCRKQMFTRRRCVRAQYIDWSETGLSRADLRGADLWGARGQGGEFTRAKLDDGVLVFANFKRSRFYRASLVRTRMLDTNFDWADLRLADLEESDLEKVDFTGADLRGANLKNVKNWRTIVSLRWANVANVRSAPPGFTVWARDSLGAVEIEDDSTWISYRAVKRMKNDDLADGIRDMGGWRPVP